MSKRPVRLPSDYRAWAKVARRVGWTIVKTGGGHLCWISPTGVLVFTPSTPGDWRGIRNVRTKLRQKGLPI